MTAPETWHSAETYVHEPGDLWLQQLPRRLRSEALRLEPLPRRAPGDEGYAWVTADGRVVASCNGQPRRTFGGTTSDRLVRRLERRGIWGAVLYPSITANAIALITDEQQRDAMLDVYNEWVLAVADERPRRLKAIALLDVADPDRAAASIECWADAGAGGFAVPAAPPEGLRYDQPRYEVIWRAAAETERPLVLIAPYRSLSQGEAGGAGFDGNEAPQATLASRLAMKATAVWPARRSVTAITYAGVFDRYPKLRLGVVGFGVGWLAYAMVRAEEMYEVRPERTGPSDHAPAPESSDQDGAAVAVAGEHRTGTVGMAPEGVGYYFPDNERFGDHVRRNCFATFDRDGVGLALRGFTGIEGLLWGEGALASDAGADPGQDPGAELRHITAGDRSRIGAGNAARIFGFEARRRVAGRPPRREYA